MPTWHNEILLALRNYFFSQSQAIEQKLGWSIFWSFIDETIILSNTYHNPEYISSKKHISLFLTQLCLLNQCFSIPCLPSENNYKNLMQLFLGKCGHTSTCNLQEPICQRHGWSMNHSPRSAETKLMSSAGLLLLHWMLRHHWILTSSQNWNPNIKSAVN